jgi:hypothetical protein
MVGFNINSQARQRALLLHYGGPDLHDIFDTLPDTGTDEELKPAIDALNKYFNPKKNVDFETIIFRRATQEADETVNMFCTRLRKLAINCDFPDKDRENKTQIIDNCTSEILRKKALEKDRSLDKILEIARTLELSNSRAQEVNSSSQVTLGKIQSARPNMTQNRRPNQNSHNRACYFCGFDYPHTGICPAQGKQCASCGKMNHFARVCRGGGSTHPRSENYRQSNTWSNFNARTKETHTGETVNRGKHTGRNNYAYG